MSDASDEEKIISSDADSDFVDVSDVEVDIDNEFLARSKLPLPPPFLMNSPPNISAANDFRLQDLQATTNKIEVVIKPGEISNVTDDIFADIFSKPTEKVEKAHEVVEIESDKEDESIKATNVDLHSSSETIIIPSEIISATLPNASRDVQMKNILDDLNNEMATATKLSLDDLLPAKPTRNINDVLKSPVKSIDIKDIESGKQPERCESPPPKVEQPFFVKKTPPSGNKKTPTKVEEKPSESPSKAIKSLLETFEQIPVKPSTSFQETNNEQETVTMAANVLRENKSQHELQKIAEQLNQERKDLAAERNKKDRLGVTITERMSMECMDLLQLFGVPYIIAPAEAEAQCAYLNDINLTDGTITDDSDIWLFGGKTVYKNFFDQNKLVMEFKLSNVSKIFHLDRRELIQLAFLVGSDYTQGMIQSLKMT